MSSNINNDIEKAASLSDFWRRKRSSKDYEELASIQRAAQGFISFISGEEYSVTWTAGTPSQSFQHKEIQLNYAPVADKDAPFSGEDIDIIIGDAVHEAGHVKFSYPKEKLEKSAARRLGFSVTYGSKGMQPIQHVANIIEDFYIENRISEEYRVRGGDSAIFGYLKAAKADAAKSPMPAWVSKELLTPDPSLEAMLAAWGRFVLVGDWSPPKESSPEAANLFEQLVNLTVKAPKAKSAPKRIKLSLDAYELVSGLRHQNEPHVQSVSQSGAEDSSINGDNQSQKTGQTRSEQEGTGRGVTGEYKEKESEDDEGDGDSEKGETEKEQPQGTSPEEKPEEDEKQIETEDKKDEAESEPEDFGPDTPDTTDLNEIESMYSIDAKEKQAPPKGLQQAIEDFIAHGAEDISSDVDNYLGGAGGERVKLSMAKLDLKKATIYEREARETARRVAMLFEWDKKLRTRYRRGLYEGKISKSRLARAGANDYRLFHKKEILAAPSLAVALLIDASGSMKRRKLIGYSPTVETDKYGYAKYNGLDIALKMATALKLAFQQRENIDVMVCAYSGPNFGGAPTDIFRIYDRASNGLRLDVAGGGGTPSGQAIASIATQMTRFVRGKDRLIIHITDGAPDDHEKVAKAVENCRKHNIEVMTLSTYKLRDEIINSYQGLVVEISDMKDLESAIPALLEKRIRRRMA